MIPTNTLEELYKAELDLQRSQVSLIREMGRGHEKSRLHAGTLQAMSSALSFVCLLYTSPSPRDLSTSRMPSSA